MNKITKQRFIAIFIGAVMLASILEVALLRNNPNNTPETAQLPDIVNRKLTLLEMRNTLGSGKVLIEYFYNESCTNCTAKENVYKEFVSSDQFKGYVILSYGASKNETADWMLDLNLEQIDLSKINTTLELENLFCDDNSTAKTMKPNVCLLKNV